jgi:WD40 repeat protein
MDNERAIAMFSLGHHIAAGSADCLIRLYDTSTSRLLKLFVGHAGPISALTFVGSDRLVSGSNDGGLCVWDTVNGHRLHTMSSAHDKRISDIASNKRGTQFATVSWDSFVFIWNIQNCRKETEIRLHPKPVSSVAFHPDGFMIVTGCWDGIIRQWNVATGQRRSIMRGHTSSIKAISYSADGRYIASCSINGECRLWNALAGSQVGLISARISSIYFSPNGSNLASAGNDGRVRVFSSTVGQCQMIIQHQEWGPVSSILIHPDGEYIIAGYHSGSIRIFDVQNGTTEDELHYHKSRIHRLAFQSIPSNMLISASGDGSSRIYDMKDLGKRTDLRIRTVILQGHTAGVLSCALSVRNMIATGSEDTTICVYHSATFFDKPSLRSSEILTQHRTPVTGVTFDQDGYQLISASRDGQVSIWSINRNSSSAVIILQNTLAHCHADWINDIALSNTNNGLLVTASNDNTLKIWNTTPKADSTTEDDTAMETVSASVEVARVTLHGHQGAVNTVRFAYGCIVSGSLDNTLRVWSHKGTEITCLRGHTEKITSCDLWVKLKGNTIQEPNNQNQWSEIINKHESEISHKTHSLDKMLVVSASEDGSIRVWRPTDPEQRCVYDAHAQPLNDIVVSNESILTSSLDKTIRSWKIPNNTFTNDNTGSSSAMTPIVSEPNSHLDEIMSIAVAHDQSLVFTVSRDMYLFVWSLLPLNSNPSTMKTGTVNSHLLKIPFTIIQSIKAHDETITGMGLIHSDKQVHTLVTGSVDQTIKFWCIRLHDDKCIIKRRRTDKTINGPVSLVSTRLTMPYFVVGENASLDSLTFHLYSSSSLERLKTYKTQTCQWPLSSLLILNEYRHCILTIGSTSHELCSYDLSLIDSTESKLLSSYSSTIERRIAMPSHWITSIDILDNQTMIYLGTADGCLYSTPTLLSNVDTWTKCRLSSKNQRINALCSIHNEFIFTSGGDNLIQVQHRNELSKIHSNINNENESNGEILGQFPVSAPITQMRVWEQSDEVKFGLVAGDTLGSLYLLQWYSS